MKPYAENWGWNAHGSSTRGYSQVRCSDSDRREYVRFYCNDGVWSHGAADADDVTAGVPSGGFTVKPYDCSQFKCAAIVQGILQIPPYCTTRSLNVGLGPGGTEEAPDGKNVLFPSELVRCIGTTPDPDWTSDKKNLLFNCNMGAWVPRAY